MKKLRALFSIMVFVFGLGAAQAYPIAEVRVIGVSGDMADSIRNMSGILAGDDYDKAKVERAEEKIQEYLENKGYPQVEIQAEAKTVENRHDLEFSVQLGEPIRIADAVFQSKDQKISPVLYTRLLQAIDLKPGELFDRDRIKEMRRSVEAVLFSQNFIDSKVADLTTEVTPNGLKLDFWLELGQKIVLSVSGNQYFARSELMSFIEEQRASGLGRDFVSVLSSRIAEHYVEQGFRNVKVTPYSFEPHGTEDKKVVFDIDEGTRVRIKNIIFDGNEVFSDNELKTLFYATAPDRISAKIYNEKMVEDAARSMIDELKKRGYLSAKLIAVKTEELGNSEVSLRIFVIEGLQTRVQAIEFHGNHVFAAEKLDQFLGMHEGDPLNLIQLEDGIDQIKKQYRNLGYLNFKILNELGNQLVSYSEKNQYAYLSFDLSEGHVIHLARYEIFGNDKTHRLVIDRELQVHPGDPLDETKTVETEERLRRLGIFSQVNLEFTDATTEPDAKDMRISVQEATPGNSSAGVGFRNDLGVRVFGELSYANLWGMNHTWALDVTANRRIEDYQFFEYTAAVSYTMPWALLGETTFRPSLSAEKRQYIEFDAETYALNLTLDRMLYKPLKFSGGLTYTLEDIRQFDDTVDTTQDQRIRIGSITPTLRLDLRDNPLVPRNGAFFLTSFEYANSALGSQTDPVGVAYDRFQARADFYTSFIPHIIWFNSIRGGWLKNLVNPYNADGSLNPNVSVPLIKQFALGGINSIRGFEEQEINVQAQDNNARVQDYSTYINYRTQMDYFATTNLSFGPFLDSGNLQVDAFSLGNLRYGTGVGMRYLTPVGPINFDWGFKLWPRPGEATNVFYFSLGVI
jgi:outer membrane protein insertion porin family